MPIIDHSDAPEVPWRPDYRKWAIAGEDERISSELSLDVVEPGAGAPLHYHEDDEMLVVLEGRVEARLGDEVAEVGPGHTIVVPPNTPHGFTSRERTTLLVFFPATRPFERTHYLEGSPPGSTV